MAMVTPEKRQAISTQVQTTLQMLAEMDLQIYGEISSETLAAVQTQGFTIQNGTVQKAESAQAETVQCESEPIAVTGKVSVRDQLHTATKEVRQHLHSEARAKSGEAR
ncbi:MAG: hypothetical protein HDT14_04160 [Oscillibacter sp.]|nr:hypothetical protein [Oscillibacter sp.]